MSNAMTMHKETVHTALETSLTLALDSPATGMATELPDFSVMDLLVGGVDYAMPGNGGPECRDHVTRQQRVVEVAIAIGLSSAALILSWMFDKRRNSSSVDTGKD
jgi:hypothetical protein